jgi:hypothetical protein
MWCLGQDISRAPTNELIEYGFSKEPPPNGMDASSRYVLEERETGREVRLWGFGIVYAEGGVGSLYLERRKFAPRLLPNRSLGTDVWRASEMPKCRKPRAESETTAAWRLLAGVCAWFSDYEAWIRREFGEEYRRRCVSAWPKKSLPAAMPEAWASLARFFERGETVSTAHFDQIPADQSSPMEEPTNHEAPLANASKINQ